MSILSKFHFKIDEPTIFINIPKEVESLLQELNSRKEKISDCNQILVGAQSKEELISLVSTFIHSISKEAKLWIVFPKKSSGIKTDLDRISSWSVFSEANWVPVTNISINETWTAVRFREKSQIKELKRNQAIEDRKTEGIDYINRTVSPSKEVIEALSQHDGLLLTFNQLSFSHQREFIESIVAAKKPETRQRRIDNMINSLQKFKDKSK